MDLRPGTLNLFILRAVADQPRHGYAIAAWLRDVSGGELAIEEGALYHALHRLERQGWLRATPGATDRNRHAKYYRLTAEGRRALARERRSWADYARLVARVLQKSSGVRS
jgi:PadR family transcriptional regulator, regulatory protein PadR